MTVHLALPSKLKAGTYTQSINGSHAGVDKDNYTITLTAQPIAMWSENKRLLTTLLLAASLTVRPILLAALVTPH